MKKIMSLIIMMSLFVACSRTHDITEANSASMSNHNATIEDHNTKWERVTTQL